VPLQNLYYGAFFQANLSLTDWVNIQWLTNPVMCLGDGPVMVRVNLFKEIATTSQWQEILDWYHLKENLYKVGGEPQRIKQAEALLWLGRVEDAGAIFDNCHPLQVVNFCAYLKKHRLGLVIGNKLRLHGSCQGDFSRSFKEKLVSVTLSLGERCDN
jgi:hypothetical protein